MASVPEFDYVIPEKNPIPALPDFAYQAIRGGLKGIYRGAIQGETKAMRKFGAARWNSPYRPPFQFFSVSNSSKTPVSMAIRRFPKKYFRKPKPVARYRRSRLLKTRKLRARRMRVYKPARMTRALGGPLVGTGFGMQSMTRRGRKPRQAIKYGKINKFKSNVPPYIEMQDGNALITWSSNLQAVHDESLGRSSFLLAMMNNWTETSGDAESGVLTENLMYYNLKNQLNAPCELEFYQWKCIRSTEKTPSQLFADGIADVGGTHPGLTMFRPYISPLMVPLFGYYFKIVRVDRVKLGGGSSYTYKLKMRGNMRLNVEVLDPPGAGGPAPEYQAGQTFGVLIIARGGICDDGTNAGLSKGKLALVRNGHMTVRAVESTQYRINTDALPNLTAENLMNIENDISTVATTA